MLPGIPMYALTNNRNDNFQTLPSFVQNQFISTLIDGISSQCPAIEDFAKSYHTQQVKWGDDEEGRERLFQSIIHLCFAYGLPVHKLLE